MNSSHDSVTESSEIPIPFSHRPLNETVSQNLQGRLKLLSNQGGGNGSCRGCSQASPTGPLQMLMSQQKLGPAHGSLQLGAADFPQLPLGTPNCPASCQRPKITQVLWRAEPFHDTNDLALLRFASFPNKNLIPEIPRKRWVNMIFCLGFKFYFSKTTMLVLMQAFEKT